MTRRTILFLSANPNRSSVRALDDECAAIERELRMTPQRDDFAFHSKWAVTVDDMMRHLGELQPTIIHFSGDSGDAGTGIHLQGDRDAPQLVTGRALTMMIKSTAASARVVVLNACYSEPQADAVRSVVDCVVGMAGAISPAAARSFAVAFYRALGNGSSVGNAVDQAVATLAGKGMPEEVIPRCVTRDGVDRYQVTLDAAGRSTSAGPRPAATRATREDVLKALSRLSPSRFDTVLLLGNVPTEHLSGGSAAQMTRAIEVIRYFEHRGQLDQLARIVDEVMGAS
jgi:hypothetical protein